jgi:hypothetical protein
VWLVLSDESDLCALWVAEGLRQRGVRVETVTARMLSAAVRWVHVVADGGSWVEVSLADGRCIDSRRVGGALNRVLSLDPPLEYMVSPDGEYALQELFALYLSLLQSLPPPVLNRPTPQGLSGRVRNAPDWLVLAARAGLATEAYTLSSRQMFSAGAVARRARPYPVERLEVIVAGGRAFSSRESPEATAAAIRLADLAGVGVLGLHLTATADGGARFAAADLYPDLRRAGPALLDHLGDLAREGESE